MSKRKERKPERGELKITWPIDAQLNERAFIERAIMCANTLGLEGKEIVDVGHDARDHRPNFMFLWMQRRLTVSPSESESKSDA